jgi:hypothetical protein
MVRETISPGEQQLSGLDGINGRYDGGHELDIDCEKGNNYQIMK